MKYFYLILALVAVALVSFGGGVYYVVSGHALPSWTQTFSSTQMISGEVESRDDASLTVRLVDGTSTRVLISADTSISRISPPTEVPLSELELGSSVNVYAIHGTALQVHIISEPTPLP